MNNGHATIILMRQFLLFVAIALISMVTGVAAADTISFDPPIVQGEMTLLTSPSAAAPDSGMEFHGHEVTYYSADSGVMWGPVEETPNNGTAFLFVDKFGSGGNVDFFRTDRKTFSLLSLDLAEGSTFPENFPPPTLVALGGRSDGSTVHAFLNLDGVMDGSGPLEDFETFLFGSEWQNLNFVSISMPGYFQLGIDNLEFSVTAVPLPAALPLMLGGLAGIGLIGRRRQSLN